VYQPSIDIPFHHLITEPVHSPQSPSYRSILILFTKLFSLFLVCISDFLVGTRVAVLWLFFCGFSPVFGSRVLFSPDGHAFIGYSVPLPTPSASVHRTHHLYSSLSSRPVTCLRVPKLLRLRVVPLLSRSEQSVFPNPLSAPFLWLYLRFIRYHRHSFTLFSPLLDLGRFHRNPFKSPLHTTHLLARHGYCVHMRSPSVCIASVQCFGRRRMKI